MKNDLTKGSLIKNIGIFAFPFLLSYLLQTLYGMADLFIVGQYNGADIISSVSIGSQVTHMLTVVIVGLSMGSVVLIGRSVGAKNKNEISKIIGNTIIIFTILAIVLTLLTYFLSSQIVSLMSTPKESIIETNYYLKICFLGIPFIIAYNIISSIFRGMGDSKSPMYFIAIACVINILLDYLFVGYFNMKSSGAALATIIAQGSSVLISLVIIIRKKMIDLSKKDLKINASIIKNIFKIGLPVALQDGFIQVSFLAITVIANRRGVDVAAAVGIVEKIISFLFLVPSTMLSTVSTISSQCIGANNKPLARKTLFTAMGISVAFGLVFAISFQFISPFVIGLFTSSQTVINLGTQYMKSYVIDTMVASIHFCFSGFFVANGLSLISFIHNVTSILTLRIPGAYLASLYFPQTLFPMGLAAPLGGILQVLICTIAYIYFRKKELI